MERKTLGDLYEMLFTFHSGYIPIADMMQAYSSDIFTFHSGYIPIIFTASFKSPIMNFTFHSGYIPIKYLPQ